MKKITATVSMVLLAGWALAQSKIIYLNSKTETCNVRGIKKECLQYKINENDTIWTLYSGSIKGFVYNPGYSYTLKVRSANAKSQQWQLLKMISKTKSIQHQQPGDTITKLSQPPTELVGRWNFTKLPAEINPVIFTKEFLVFDPAEMRVNGKASCNGFFGNYTAGTGSSKKEIHFEAIGHTMMACDNLATENIMLKAMEKVTAWSREGNKLYLKAGTITLIELTLETTGVI